MGTPRSASDFVLVGAGSLSRLSSPQRSSFSVFPRRGDFSYFSQPPRVRRDFSKQHFISALHSACAGCLTSELKLARRIPLSRRSSVERIVLKHSKLWPIRFLSALLLRSPAISPLDPSLHYAQCLFVRFQLVGENAQFLETSLVHTIGNHRRLYATFRLLRKYSLVSKRSSGEDKPSYFIALRISCRAAMSTFTPGLLGPVETSESP